MGGWFAAGVEGHAGGGAAGVGAWGQVGEVVAGEVAGAAAAAVEVGACAGEGGVGFGHGGGVAGCEVGAHFGRGTLMLLLLLLEG